MKKKRASLLFGSILLMLAGYTAWCGRSMYLSVPVPELLEIPEKFREDAKSIVVEHGLTRPDPFSFAVLKRLLIHPYDSAPRTINVHTRDLVTRVTRFRRSPRIEEPDLAFYPMKITWEVQARNRRGKVAPDRELKAR